MTAPLASLVELLDDDPVLARTRTLGVGDDRIVIAESARALALSALSRRGGRPMLVICPTSTDAERLAAEMQPFLGDAVAVFPAWETLPFERVSPAIDTMGRRCEVLWRLGAGGEETPSVIVTGARAVLQRIGPAIMDPILIERAGHIDPDVLVAQLVERGYRNEPLVEHRGEFARRGAIIDIFASTAEAPIRIDLWGDEVERLTEFSVNDQRSTVELDTARIFPARELLPVASVRERARDLVASEPWGREHWERLGEGLIFDGMESWLPWLTDDERLIIDLIGAEARVVLVEPRRLRDRALDLLAEEDDLARSLASTWARDPERGFPRLHADPDTLLSGREFEPGALLSIESSAPDPETPTLGASGWAAAPDGPGALIERLVHLLAQDHRVVITADGASSAERLQALLLEHGLDVTCHETAGAVAAGRAVIVVAALQRGCLLPSADLAIVTEADLTGRRRVHRTSRPRRRDSISTFEDLRLGDHVVHHHHGVGRYEGMVTRSIGGIERDYLLLAYKGNDKLYVPTDQIGVLRPYVGGETPTLHRLGGSDFAAAKSRVRSAVREIAQELVLLYQQRVNASGHAFGADTPWQSELESSFPFVETPDQLRAITEIKADMEREHPMDRLVCGDVGFGKTEVAIRAAFKAIQDGKQVAVLVPTTLLAGQHGTTFADRFADFPIHVEVLSRFLTASQAKKVIAGLASGDVDCVIGTHRLLNDDIRFKDLGLLIVDEEQRFGVHHKEAMKKLRTNVDVLTLSATPIPRTLEMSLVGIRDLSLLQTPPADRQPILTFVGEYDERVAVEAIRRELLREGQVFWVHNRVRSIVDAAERLRELVPEARIAVAHGQLDEGTLEQVVLDFWEGRYDVLVCTTIIESGIDMPTVNTLVVERADLLGLGQLHQLRGRVGRSGSRAYAYLFHPRDIALSEEAYERLRTIGESTELGSGFRIAMRDLELRGAGNLLGPAQSGHIAAVGYDLYCQMVTEVVAEMRGDPVRAAPEITIDVPGDAHLPPQYVPTEELRLEAYRRLATVTTSADVDDLRAEWEDRYGPLPDPARSLLDIGSLRAWCHRLGLEQIQVTGAAGRGAEARIGPISLNASQSIRLRRLSQRLPRPAVHREDARQLVVPLPAVRPGVDAPGPAAFLAGFLDELIGAS